MFENLKTDESIAEDTDFIGGNSALESDIYTFVIDMAYIDKSSGGAMSLNLHLKTMQGQNLKQTIYITSGDAKGNRNYFMVKKNNQETGEKRYLPGFNIANAICLLAIGKEISTIPSEEKTINIYDFAQKKEVEVKKQVLMSLLGADIDLGVIKQIVDKKQKDDNGIYVSTGETRIENEIDKVFRTRDGMTVAEIKALSEEAAFHDKWLEKNKGQTKDLSTKTDSGASTGLPTGTSTTEAANTASLFG
jgi:hypothetical protein